MLMHGLIQIYTGSNENEEKKEKKNSLTRRDKGGEGKHPIR